MYTDVISACLYLLAAFQTPVVNTGCGAEYIHVAQFAHWYTHVHVCTCVYQWTCMCVYMCTMIMYCTSGFVLCGVYTSTTEHTLLRVCMCLHVYTFSRTTGLSCMENLHNRAHTTACSPLSFSLSRHSQTTDSGETRALQCDI